MSTQDPYALSDEDRLPWLEPVDDGEAQVRGGSGRAWLLPVLALLVLAAVVVAGVWWWQNRTVEPTGSGELIAAPEGPYKVKPTEEGGITIEGQGETAFATSEGAEVQGSLDLGAVPETPVDRAPPPKVEATPKAGASASAAVSQGGQVVAKAPPAELQPETVAGATIQLGAFPTQESAKKSWDTMQKRFAYLGERTPNIVKAEVNGRTFHRLRVGTGSATEARDICARLRVAGENCLVVS